MEILKIVKRISGSVNDPAAVYRRALLIRRAVNSAQKLPGA